MYEIKNNTEARVASTERTSGVCYLLALPA